MRKVWTRMVLSSALAGGLLLTMGIPAHADRDKRNDCQKKLEGDRARIERDSARYGEHSRQVDRDRDRMDATRRWCRDHKADWDHDRFDIGIYIRK